MVCPSVHTGARFLSAILYALDCQARSIGGYGYGALANPSSSVSLALTALITVFVALFGFRLLFGPTPAARDMVGDVLRIGLVLAIASAWPAWRTVAYDVVFDGPVEIARTIGASSGLPGSDAMINRLQQADDGIILATTFGSGRLTGGISNGADVGDATSGVALPDTWALGVARSTFLASTIGSFAIVRLCAGIMLAIAPLMAGLALFGWTLGVFIGWLRALAFCALGSLVLFVAQGAMIALLFPWLSEVLKLRQGNALTASAPTELLAMSLGFAVLTFGALALVARLTFFSAGQSIFRPIVRSYRPARDRTKPLQEQPRRTAPDQPSRAETVAGALQTSMLRSSRESREERLSQVRSTAAQPAQAAERSTISSPPILADTFRRSHRRTGVNAGMRNSKG